MNHHFSLCGIIFLYYMKLKWLLLTWLIKISFTFLLARANWPISVKKATIIIVIVILLLFDSWSLFAKRERENPLELFFSKRSKLFIMRKVRKMNLICLWKKDSFSFLWKLNWAHRFSWELSRKRKDHQHFELLLSHLSWIAWMMGFKRKRIFLSSGIAFFFCCTTMKERG